MFAKWSGRRENTAPAAEERTSCSKRTRGSWEPGSGEQAQRVPDATAPCVAPLQPQHPRAPCNTSRAPGEYQRCHASLTFTSRKKIRLSVGDVADRVTEM